VNPDNAKYFDKFGRTAGKAVRWCVRTATIPAVKWLVDFPFFPRPDTSRACADTVAGSHSFETQVTWTAGLLALVLALILSGGYFYFSYQHLQGGLEAECRWQAAAVSEFINRNVPGWRFEAGGIETILQRYSAHRSARVIAADRQPLAQVSVELAWPVAACRQPVHESGIPAGWLELRESLHQQVLAAAVIGMVGLLIGLVVFFPLRWLPLRALRRATAALTQSEDRYRSVVASLREGVLVVDTQCEIVASNDSARRILGARLRDWVRAERCADWMLTEEGGALALDEHPLRRTLSTGRSCDDVVMGLHTGEGTLWIAVNTRPLWRRGEEKPHGVVVSVTDVTEHRQAEENLRLAAQAFDNTTDGIMTTDAHARIVSVNRAFTTITGYTPEEVIGKTPAILRSGHHDREFYERMRQTLAETGSWQGESGIAQSRGKPTRSGSISVPSRIVMIGSLITWVLFPTFRCASATKKSDCGTWLITTC
jgi:PAS domain S-box-containing protein